MSRSSGGVTMVVTSTMTTEAENTSRPKVRLTPKEFELLTEPWLELALRDAHHRVAAVARRADDTREAEHP